LPGDRASQPKRAERLRVHRPRIPEIGPRSLPGRGISSDKNQSEHDSTAAMTDRRHSFSAMGTQSFVAAGSRSVHLRARRHPSSVRSSPIPTDSARAGSHAKSLRKTRRRPSKRASRSEQLRHADTTRKPSYRSVQQNSSLGSCFDPFSADNPNPVAASISPWMSPLSRGIPRSSSVRQEV